jgi:hypothetical protein
LGILSGCFGEERTLLSRLGVKPWLFSHQTVVWTPDHLRYLVEVMSVAPLITGVRLALGPTQSNRLWVMVVLSSEVKWPGHEADHSALVLRFRMHGARPPHLHVF